jgi:hypothetical protein
MIIEKDRYYIVTFMESPRTTTYVLCDSKCSKTRPLINKNVAIDITFKYPQIQFMRDKEYFQMLKERYLAKKNKEVANG